VLVLLLAWLREIVNGCFQGAGRDCNDPHK